MLLLNDDFGTSELHLASYPCVINCLMNVYACLVKLVLELYFAVGRVC